MNDDFNRYQREATLRNLHSENTYLRNEIKRFQEEALKNKAILDFHDRLEKDFFSADSLDNLVIKLINCLQLRPDIDFVSVCLSKQYMETILGSQGYELLLPSMGVPKKLGYLSIIDESDIGQYLHDPENLLFEKTPHGSTDLFFPGHAKEVRSHAIIPLTLRGHIIGSLNLGSFRTNHYYTTEMGPHLLSRLSSKLSIAIDSILSHQRLAVQREILDRDINRAAILQKSLLPPSPLRTDSLEISAHFFPCQKLGGDFYDAILLSPEKVALIIADVAGHGISAALIAAMLKFSLEVPQIEESSAEELISTLNRKFCQILREGDYITLCYAVIDTGRLKMNLVRGGHPYPILYQPFSRDLLALKPFGPPLGLDEEARYENMEVALHSGDVILFYTDGLTSALFGEGEAHDSDQILQLLKDDLAGGDIRRRIEETIGGLERGRELEDDTSLLIVRLT